MLASVFLDAVIQSLWSSNLPFTNSYIYIKTACTLKLSFFGSKKPTAIKMGYPDTFEGFCVAGPKTWSDFKKQELKPKPFGPNDIDVQIEACGVCGSDVHTITGGWGDYEGPLCVGHEVVGKAIKVGKDVKV